MLRDLNNLKGGSFDVLVIGGGINGAATAHLSASAGLKTALIEKNDFASGTSGRSSKLIHGGIRYLENFQIHLVYESLRERFEHVHDIPHLVRPLRFIIPVYRGDRRPLWMMRLGVRLYDAMAGSRNVGVRKNMNTQEILNHFPALNGEELEGGVSYWDAQMDDARVCLEQALAAARAGASVANHVETVEFIKESGKAVGVRVTDRLSGADFEIRARQIVVAAGPWTNRLLRLDDPSAAPRVRTTKGIHLVYPFQLSDDALLIPSRSDRRIFFILPWHGNTMIGTTDTDYTGDPDAVRAERVDVQYLIRETKRVFPDLGLSIGTGEVSFAGLRPLLAQEGNPSRVSREHEIFRTASGILFVAGGKYTTFRRVACDCVARFHRRLSPDRMRLKLFVTPGERQAWRSSGLSHDTLAALESKYGRRAGEIVERVNRDPAMREPLSPGLPWIRAQLAHAMEAEMACTEEDIVERRLGLSSMARQLQVSGDLVLRRIGELGLPARG